MAGAEFDEDGDDNDDDDDDELLVVMMVGVVRVAVLAEVVFDKSVGDVMDLVGLIAASLIQSKRVSSLAGNGVTTNLIE